MEITFSLFAHHDREFCSHLGTEEASRILQTEDRVDRATLLVGAGAEAQQFPFEFFFWQGRHLDVRFRGGRHQPGLMFGDTGDGVNFVKIRDLEERILRINGVAETDIDVGDEPAERGLEGDHRRRIAGLAALDLRDFITSFHRVARGKPQVQDTA